MLRSFTIATMLTAGSIGSAAAQYYGNPYNQYSNYPMYSGYGPGPGYPNARSQSIGGPEDAGGLNNPPRQNNPQVGAGCVERTICVENSCKRARICP